MCAGTKGGQMCGTKALVVRCVVQKLWWSVVWYKSSSGQMCGTKAYLDEEWSAHAWPRGAVNPRAGLDYLSHECVACSYPSWEGT